MQKEFWEKGLVIWQKYKLQIKTAAVVVVLAGGFIWGATAYMEYMDAQIKPVEAKTPADVKQVLAAREKSGCKNAEFFVKLNVLLRDVDNPESFFAVLDGMRFENGKVVYPRVSAKVQPQVLVTVKNFFDSLKIVNAEEFAQCVKFAHSAQNYNEAKVVMFMSTAAGK